METMLEYFTTHNKKKTEMKVFLVGGAMLLGKITSFDEHSIVLNNCLIQVEKIISMTPKE